MKRKLKIKNIIVLLFLLIVLCAVYLFINPPIKMSLIGDENITLSLNSEYVDLGCKASITGKDLTNIIIISNNVDTSKIGKYIIEYSVKYNNKIKKITRNVNVVDDVAPVIKLNGGNDIVFITNDYKDLGATAIDNYDGDITDKIIVENNIDSNVAGVYEVKYTVTDSSGNTSSISRNVEVVDGEKAEKIAVLNYHFFYSDGENCSESICLNTNKFEEQLKYLKDNGYKTLTMNEFVRWMYGEIELPKKSVLLTVDDGAMGTGLHNGNKLIPLLEKYEMHATLFLVTGWWDIENYRSPYLDIQSHTNDMHNEGFCSGVSRGARMLCSSHDVALNDLKKSIEIIGNADSFCFPFYAYDDDAIEVVKEAGFKVAFIGGGYKASRNNNKYMIPRYPIQSNITLNTFINYIS